MRFSERGVRPQYDGMRAAKAATIPLKASFFADLEGSSEAHSLDGRMWSVMQNGVRKVKLFADDGTLIDEIPVRTVWYEAVEYRYWARGANWILYTNEVIVHDGETLTRHPLMYEYPLDEERYTLTEGEPLSGRTGVFDQYIMMHDWKPTHSNPFPWNDDEYTVPPALRFLKAHEGKLFLGRWILDLTDGAPLWNPVAPRAYMIAGEVMSYPTPQVSYDIMVRENSFRLNECELSIVDGKLYASAYRWIGRAYLYSHDFTADGTGAQVYYMLVTNSHGANVGDMATSIGTETGEAVITPQLTAFKRGYDTIDSGPWRSSDGSSVVTPSGQQIDLEDGIVSMCAGARSIRVAQGAWAEHTAEGGVFAEGLRGQISGAAQTWLNPGGLGGGAVSDLVVGPSRDMTVYTNEEKFNRLVSVGSPVLPRQADEYVVLDSYKEDGGKLYRTRLLREGTVTEEVPDWDEIIKAPVKLSIVHTLIGEQWDMADGPVIFKTSRSGTPSGVHNFYASEWGTDPIIPFKWITNTGALVDDTLYYYGLAANEYLKFPVCSGSSVSSQLFRDGALVSTTTLEVPEACAGMWKRNFASWDYKAADTVGIHCNFQQTQTGIGIIHAPATILKEGALLGGRAGYMVFYHATTGNIFHLNDSFFVDMVADMEVSAPTAANPSPALYVPNGGAWLKEYGADSFVDAFGKTRYRQNVAVIANWDGRNVNSGGQRKWNAHRLIVIKMELDTESLDLAEIAVGCQINR